MSPIPPYATVGLDEPELTPEAVEEAVRPVGSWRPTTKLSRTPSPSCIADGSRCRRLDERLDVHVFVGRHVVDGEVPTVATDLRLALPHAVAPLGVRVADPEHVEIEQRLQVIVDGSPVNGIISISHDAGARVPGRQSMR